MPKSITITAETEIYPEDYLGDIPTTSLEDELNGRKDFHGHAVTQVSKQVLDMLHGGRTREAIQLLERTLHPKWYDAEQCQKDYDHAMVDTRHARANGKVNTGTPAVHGGNGHAK